MYLTTAFSAAAKLTTERKKQIRRNEQIRQEHYAHPQLFKLLKVGVTKSLEQGDVVLGKVKVVTTKKIACQIIYVEFKGVAIVDFNVPSTTMIDEIQNFHKEWEFFNHKIPVFMHEQKGYNFIDPGIYEFYFKARVPVGGPGTFITDIASVTYKFSGVLVRNDVTVDVYSQNDLTYHVCGYKDLNPYDGARIGLLQEKFTYVGGLFGICRGKVEIKVKTDKRAFVPGDKIYIEGEVENTTWRKCELHYELLQIVKMYGSHYFWRSDKWGNRFLKDELVMDRGKRRVIKSGETIKIKETLLIPKGIEPSYLGMSAKDYINDLINLEYRLRFDVEIPYNTDLRVTIPIIIGTERFMQLRNPPMISNRSSIPNFFKVPGLKESLEDEESATRLITQFPDANVDAPLTIPRFHPLNPSLQKKFPESFKFHQADDEINAEGKRGKGRQSKCPCKKKHKKRHHTWGSDSSTDFYLSRGKKKESGPGKVKTDYGHGIPLEECTFANWLATTVEELGEPGQDESQLFNIMRQYGLIST